MGYYDCSKKAQAEAERDEVKKTIAANTHCVWVFDSHSR